MGARLKLVQPALTKNLVSTNQSYTDEHLRRIFEKVNTIAMVGASTHWNSPSYFVMKYLQRKNFRVIPVNPRSAGKELLGELIVDNLTAIKERIDMVEIFRHSSEAGAITDEAIDIGASVVWMQIGVRDKQAAARAEAAGLTVIMNRCPKIEFSRLNGELGWHGINSGQITSKRRRL